MTFTHLVVDTTGLKVFGEREWQVRQHGWVKRRAWRKLHLAVNSETQVIEAFEKFTPIRQIWLIISVTH